MAPAGWRLVLMPACTKGMSLALLGFDCGGLDTLAPFVRAAPACRFKQLLLW